MVSSSYSDLQRRDKYIKIIGKCFKRKDKRGFEKRKRKRRNQ